MDAALRAEHRWAQLHGKKEWLARALAEEGGGQVKENIKDGGETIDVQMLNMEEKVRNLKEKLSKEKAEKLEAKQRLTKIDEINRKLKTEVKRAEKEVVAMKRRYRRVKEELETAVEWSRHLEGEVVDLRTELELGTMKQKVKTSTDEKKRNYEKEEAQTASMKASDNENNVSEAEMVVKSAAKMGKDDQKMTSVDEIKQPLKEKHHTCFVKKCNLRFTRKGNLDDHMRKVHGDPKLQCSEPGCPKTFVTSRGLRNHNLIVHKGIRPAKCNVEGCGKKYVRKRDLKDHKRASHGKAKLRCPEPGCHEEFAWTASFYRHRKEHML